MPYLLFLRPEYRNRGLIVPKTTIYNRNKKSPANNEANSNDSMSSNGMQDIMTPNVDDITEAHSDDSMTDEVENGIEDVVNEFPLFTSLNEYEPATEKDTVDIEEMDRNKDKNEEITSPPIFPGSNLTVAQSEALILGYIIRHGITDVGLQDLLYLIDAHLPRPVHESKYFFFKNIGIYNDEKDVQEYYYCTDCNNILEVNEGEEKKRTAKCIMELCPKRNIEFYVNKLKMETKNFFLYVPMKPQLQKLLNDEEIVKTLSKTRPGGVTSGEYYQNLIQDGTIGENDITLQWNTDGAGAFKSSAVSLWPIFVGINEMPYVERKKNLLLVALWFGSKPNMNTFLIPFVDELNKLHDEGLTLNDGRKVKVHCLVAPMDSMARPLVQNIQQHNAVFGCSYCLLGSKQMEGTKGNVRKYSGNVGDLRTVEQHIGDIEACLRTGKPTNGVKGPSIAMLIPSFDIIDGLPPDYLHNALGVVKMFLSNFVDGSNSEEEWYIGGQNYKILNERLQQICPPSEISRFPSDLKHLKTWKASEFRSFILYYAAPTLKGVLPQKYFEHFMLLVFSVTMFLKGSITDVDFNTASVAMERFVLSTPTLYNESFMSFNTHLLLHVPRYVLKWGQLWDTSCFIYEFYNGILLELYHGTQHLPHQVVKNYLRMKVLNILLEKHFNNDKVLMLGRATQKLCKSFFEKYMISDGGAINHKEKIAPLGTGYLQDLSVPEKFAVENFLNTPLNNDRLYKTYERLKVNKTVITSANYARARRNNSVVRLKDSSIFQIEKIIIYDQNLYLLIGIELIEDGRGISNRKGLLKSLPSVVKKTVPKKVIREDFIKNKCVFMTFGDDKCYVADIVNNFERD